MCLLVAVLDLIGAVVAVRAGLSGLGRTVLSGTAVNAPLPFLAAECAAAFVAIKLSPGRGGLAAAALLVAMGLVSVLSGLGDGSYTRTLTAVERTIQLALVTATIGMTLSAAALLVRTSGLRSLP